MENLILRQISLTHKVALIVVSNVQNEWNWLKKKKNLAVAVEI